MAFSAGRLMFCRRWRLLSGYSSCSSPSDVARTMTTSTAPTKIQNTSTCCSPWLMLPPSFKNGVDVNYNFYSFSERKLLTRPQISTLKGVPTDSMLNFRVRGSSHGWLALFNPHTLDLFLYNPISLRHIKLPPLPNFPRDNTRGVTKVTLSCSPDEEDQRNCCAAVIYAGALAFCCPGRSKEWTPITGQMAAYKDIVYSNRQNLFFSLNKSYELVTWDLMRDRPRMIKMIKTGEDKYFDIGECDIFPKEKVEYLVVADEHLSSNDDDVLSVTWYIDDYLLPDDSIASSDLYPPENIGFHIDVYDEAEGELRPLVEGLGDLTLFIGCHSDSVALSSASTPIPELMPNTIYFTHPFEQTSEGSAILFGSYDFGIFHNEHNTLSGCYIPCDIKRRKKVVPSNVWFFPRA